MAFSRRNTITGSVNFTGLPALYASIAEEGRNVKSHKRKIGQLVESVDKLKNVTSEVITELIVNPDMELPPDFKRISPLLQDALQFIRSHGKEGLLSKATSSGATRKDFDDLHGQIIKVISVTERFAEGESIRTQKRRQTVSSVHPPSAAVAAAAVADSSSSSTLATTDTTALPPPPPPPTEQQSTKPPTSPEAQAALDSVLSEAANKVCVDCGTAGPHWASTNLGVFICIKCSGVHRSLGVEISAVKSTELDSWIDSEVAHMRERGNAKVNSELLASMLPEHAINSDTLPRERSAFIRAKYISKTFTAPGYVWPPPADTSNANEAGSNATQGLVEFEGILTITLLEAKDLIVADYTGSSDPYAVLRIGHQQTRSRTIKRTLNPRWNETLSLCVPSVATSKMEVQVFDWDMATEDDEMGQAAVDLSSLQDGVPEDVWVTLLGVKSGQLHLVLTFTKLQ